MARGFLAMVWLWGVAAWGQTEGVEMVDGGTGAGAAEVPVVPASGVSTPAPAPVASAESPGPFDLVQSPWGPGRKASGEKFSSAATALEPGPFRLAGEKWSLGFGGQYFVRGELRDNRDYSSAVGDHELSIEHRARVSMRGSVFGRVGVVLEFQDVRWWGSEPNAVTTTPNTGLHQGYVDVKVAEWLDVRVGRQELSYGEERLIGNLDWAQSARAFDGVFLRVTASPTTTVDAFGMMLRPPAWLSSGASGFHNSGQFFYGLYSRFRLSKALGVDGYALGLHNDAGSAATGPGPDTNLATLGARVSVSLGALGLLGEGAFQTGQQGAALILAGAFAGRGTYTFAAPGKWYVGAEVLGASGDGDAADTTHRTFNQLFPSGHIHLGFMDYVGWQNVLGFKGSVGFRPFDAHLWLDVHHFRFWDARGASYSASGAQFIAADSGRTDANLGTELDVNATVPLTKYVAVSGAFAVFLPGGGSASRGTSPSTWGFVSVRSQF
jgi:hypothetical protein